MTAGALSDERTAAPAAHLLAGSRVDALDGVRAVAVIAVLAVHAFPRSDLPGAVGVDMFFVLSGCLITSLLLAERERHGAVDLRRFWARRFLRLAPPLLLWLVALYPLGVSLVGDVYAQRALLVAQFWPNLALTVRHISLTPLEHTWSLGQEAQFYLLWPLLLLGLLGRVSRPVLAAACAAGTVWSLHALYVVQVADVRPTDDFRLDGRAAGLLLGCALALVLSVRRELLAVPGAAELGLLGLLGLHAYALLVAPVSLQAAVPVAVACSALLVGGLLGRGSGPTSALLSSPPLLYVGRISYSLYLWHYPFFRAFERRPDLPVVVVVLLETALSVAAAAVSYAVVEQPLARWSASRLHR